MDVDELIKTLREGSFLGADIIDALDALKRQRDNLVEKGLDLIEEREALKARVAELEQEMKERLEMREQVASAFVSTLSEFSESRATALAAENDRLTRLLRLGLNVIDAMIRNDPNEPISDAGHTFLDLWKHEAEHIRAALEKGNPNG